MIRLREDTAERVWDCMSSKQLAEQMHGHIEVESEPGRGSTFSCAIKVKVPVQAVKQEKEQNIEFDISNLKNHLLGTQAKSRMESGLYVWKRS